MILRRSMTLPITWEPPLDPPDQPLSGPEGKVEAFFEKQGYAPKSIDDIKWALGEMRMFLEPESGEVDLTDEELEYIFDEVSTALEGYFDDTENAA